MAYKDILGDDAKPIYAAFGFEGHTYQGVQRAEVRVTDSKIQIDVHGDAAFKVLQIDETGTTLKEISNGLMTVTTLGTENSLSVTQQKFDYSKGPTGEIRETAPATIEASALAIQRVRDTAIAVYAAAKEYIESDKVQPVIKQGAILLAADKTPRRNN